MATAQLRWERLAFRAWLNAGGRTRPAAGAPRLKGQAGELCILLFTMHYMANFC